MERLCGFRFDSGVPCRYHFVVLVLYVATRFGSAVEFNNKIVNEPTVQCGASDITISVATTISSQPPSRIFAKGQHAKADCFVENVFSATFSLSGCNMNRQRQLTPRGLSYSLVVVVQMHPLFITKVDRAYNVRCFYMEADKSLTANLDVSMLTTQVVEETHAMPQCMYTIHSGSREGPLVRYATIGEAVYHVWTCPSDVYGLLVHSCYVDDRQDQRIQVVDENGCGVDEVVMRTPTYATDLTTAFTETHVFKFADKINVRFNCQIRLCFRSAGGCDEITPPICADSGGVATRERIVQTTPKAAQDVVKPVELPVDGVAPVIPPGLDVAPVKPPGADGDLGFARDEITSESFIEVNVTTTTSGSAANETAVDVNATTVAPLLNVTESDSAANETIEGSGEELFITGLGALYHQNETQDTRGRRNVKTAVLKARDDPINFKVHGYKRGFPAPELDLDQEMFVLEPEDQTSSPDSFLTENLLEELRADESEQATDMARSVPRVCLSTVGFSMVMTAFALMILLCSMAIVCLCYRQRDLSDSCEKAAVRRAAAHHYWPSFRLYK